MIKHELYAYDQFKINNSVASQDESTQHYIFQINNSININNSIYTFINLINNITKC